MAINDQVKDYRTCPFKKRRVLIEQDEQCEPENLSTKPEDLSRKCSQFANGSQSRDRKPDIYGRISAVEVPSTTIPNTVLKPDIPTKQETYIRPSIYYPDINEPIFKPWANPLTQPSYFTASTNENINPVDYSPTPYPNQYESQYRHCKDGSLLKLNAPTLNSNMTSALDLRTYYNNNIIKTKPYQIRFTPYKVNQHRPLTNIFPLSPPSSRSSSCYSYASRRRSVSPVSATSSLSENLPINYSIFCDESSIALEQQQQHQKSKPESANAHYQCSVCSKSYLTHSTLSNHLKFHCSAVGGNEGKEIFCCKICDKPYTSSGALKMHIRTHTLPYKCLICGKSFSRPWLLQGHTRTHTGEKPFSCQYCHRAFADRSNLRAHLQTHFDVKKYSCTRCVKTFSRMSLLTKHTQNECAGMHHLISQYYL